MTAVLGCSSPKKLFPEELLALQGKKLEGAKVSFSDPFRIATPQGDTIYVSREDRGVILRTRYKYRDIPLIIEVYIGDNVIPFVFCEEDRAYKILYAKQLGRTPQGYHSYAEGSLIYLDRLVWVEKIYLED